MKDYLWVVEYQDEDSGEWGWGSTCHSRADARYVLKQNKAWSDEKYRIAKYIRWDIVR